MHEGIDSRFHNLRIRGYKGLHDTQDLFEVHFIILEHQGEHSGAELGIIGQLKRKLEINDTKQFQDLDTLLIISLQTK